MTNPTPELGKLIEGNPGRDAIHIAIAPVIANEALNPGQHIGIEKYDEKKGMFYVGDVLPYIGIVDPFLSSSVIEGDRIYLCLYPGTVTSLRHVYSHPALKIPV